MERKGSGRKLQEKASWFVHTQNDTNNFNAQNDVLLI
jgi:hypothetical protein